MPLSDAAAPSKDEVLAELRSLMKSEFGLEAHQLEPATHLIEDLDLDSIDLVDLAVSLEERSGLKLSDEELRSVETFGDAVDVIHAAFARRRGGSA